VKIIPLMAEGVCASNLCFEWYQDQTKNNTTCLGGTSLFRYSSIKTALSAQSISWIDCHMTEDGGSSKLLKFGHSLFDT